MTIRSLPSFTAWLGGLKEETTKARISQHVERLAAGLGDVKSVGGGVTELRIDFGPGWRVYYANVQGQVILLIGGGDKSTQQADINAAKNVVAELKKKAADTRKAAAKPGRK